METDINILVYLNSHYKKANNFFRVLRTKLNQYVYNSFHCLYIPPILLNRFKFLK